MMITYCIEFYFSTSSHLLLPVAVCDFMESSLNLNQRNSLFSAIREMFYVLVEFIFFIFMFNQGWLPNV